MSWRGSMSQFQWNEGCGLSPFRRYDAVTIMQGKRDFISIDQFSNEEMLELFLIADRMNELLKTSHGVLAGHIMGSLFLEPSTRTRLSFEAAMNRLGGRVITMSDVQTSSIVKGETLADSVRTVASYADLIVLRHPLAGAARLAADYSHVPVINAGDGGHEHPTQTLCDLYTLRTTRGRIDGLKVVLYGDLKHGRTTHSLAKALVRMGADVLAIPVPRLELPSYVVEEMRQVESLDIREAKLSGLDVALGGVRNGTLFSHNPAVWGTDGDCIGLEDVALDALYVTRIQKERLNELEDSTGNPLPNVDTAFLSAPQFSDAVVLHPLPRLDEIDPEVDSDPRGIYFQQAALGVPIRMALLSVLLGRETLRAESPHSTCSLADPEGGICRNSACVMTTEGDYLEQLAVQSKTGGTLRCRYCEGDLRMSPSI